MKSDRLFQILYILLNQERITAPELANALSVSVRTVYRDVEALSMVGIPIYCLTGRGGGIRLMPEFTMDKAILMEDEWKQVIFALQSMKISGEDVEKLLSKIQTVSGNQTSNWIEINFSRWGHNEKDTIKFETLKDAIIGKQIVLIQYYDAHGKQTSRKIKPVRLVFRSANWYLMGYCLRSEDFRCFKLNRIAWVEVTNQNYEDNFDQVPEIETENNTGYITYQFKIDHKEAYRAYEDFDKDSIRKNDDNTIQLTVKLPYDRWILSYIMSYGTHIEILEPVWLKDEIKKYIKELGLFYKI